MTETQYTVTLDNNGNTFNCPVSQVNTSSMTCNFSNVPPGTYQLSFLQSGVVFANQLMLYVTLLGNGTSLYTSGGDSLYQAIGSMADLQSFMHDGIMTAQFGTFSSGNVQGNTAVRIVWILHDIFDWYTTE